MAMVRLLKPPALTQLTGIKTTKDILLNHILNLHWGTLQDNLVEQSLGLTVLAPTKVCESGGIEIESIFASKCWVGDGGGIVSGCLYQFVMQAAHELARAW